MMERSVALISAPRDMVPNSTVRAPVVGGCPPAGEVMWDILFDSSGFLTERRFLRAVLDETGGVSERVERIHGSIRMGRWDQGVDGFVELLEYLLDGGAIVVSLRRLNARLGRRFLRSTVSGLAFLADTGHAIAALGLAFHRYRNRLLSRLVGRDSQKRN